MNFARFVAPLVRLAFRGVFIALGVPSKAQGSLWRRLRRSQAARAPFGLAALGLGFVFWRSQKVPRAGFFCPLPSPLWAKGGRMASRSTDKPISFFGRYILMNKNLTKIIFYVFLELSLFVFLSNFTKKYLNVGLFLGQ